MENIKMLTSKNLVVNKMYSSIGTYNDCYLGIFSYDDKIAVTRTNFGTKTITKKEKEVAKEYDKANITIKSKVTGSLKVSNADGYSTINTYENEVYNNGKLLACITTYENELQF